ncbi:MAG: hypothetical protein J6Y47_03740 [Bacteroidales bacterium]|nr:hypothetical protein [Bacteroidales bacterium]
MVKYPLHYQNEDDFENLVTLICKKILGEGVIPFAKGRDGGKDGRFTGTANCFPSENDPWKGKIIVQAKHTEKIQASCSDSDFNKTVGEEIEKIKNLKSKDEIDYYLLFTNRKLTGGADSKIVKRIKEETGIENNLIAEEKLQQYLVQFPDVVKMAGLNKLLMPLEFDDSDIRDVVLAIKDTLKAEDISSPIIDFSKIELTQKNKLNNLSEDYFSNVIQSEFADFSRIERFLSDPINEEVKEGYEDAISDLNAKITIHRDKYNGFEEIIDDIYDKVISQNADTLKGNKRLVRTLLHYMYCKCDIGKKA